MSVPWIGYAGAIKAPGKVTGDRGNYVIRYIVCHGTGWPQSFDDYVKGAAQQCAVTYMVSKDGRVAQFESEASNHWGNGVMSATSGIWPEWAKRGVTDPNRISISIEHEKHAKDNSDQLTPAQRDASFRLIADICRRNPTVPPVRGDDSMEGGIIPHSNVNPKYRSYCPGPYPWDELFAYLRNSLGPHVPAGWTDDGTILRPPATWPWEK